MKKTFILINILIMLSCKFSIFKKNVPVYTKYRENNPIEILKIDSIYGNIDIIGWQNNLIEIESEKNISTGFQNDINLLDTIFTKNNNELNISTKIPERVKGIINLKVFIPFMLLKIYIHSKSGNININKYLGDIELYQSKGNTNIVFYGNILRLNAENSKLNLNINSYNSSDIVIINKDGNTKVKINEIGYNSFIDAKSLNGDIDFLISDHIPHQFSVINQNKIYINYNYKKISSKSGKYNYIFGTSNSGKSKCIIDISNLIGKINIKKF